MHRPSGDTFMSHVRKSFPQAFTFIKFEYLLLREKVDGGISVILLGSRDYTYDSEIF
jgi:hypothetical protein